MASRNDITGDLIATKKPSEAYRDGWERIFKKEVKTEVQNTSEQLETAEDDKTQPKT